MGKSITYIKLINLENRYSQKSGYGIVELLTSTIYATIKEVENHGQIVSDEDIEKYISSKLRLKHNHTILLYQIY